MNEFLNKIKPYRSWLIAGLVVFVVLGAWLSRYLSQPATSGQTQVETLDKLLGVTPMPVEKLKSYESVTGVVDIQYWITENGVRVYFVPVHTLPMVDIAVVFDAGASRNGKKGGLAYLTNELLSEGTNDLTANQIAQKFDEVGAQVQSQSLRDMAMISLRSLSSPKELSIAVKTLGQVLSEPSFPEEDFKREQRNMIVALKQQLQLPQHVANKAMYSLLYGSQPYSNWVLGDEDAVRKLTVADVKDFYRKYYVANNAVVAIVGDVDLEGANAIARTLTQDLLPGGCAPMLPEVENLKQTTSKKIDFPSAQTHILIAAPGIKRHDPDYYALTVGNHILGGNGSVSRVFDTIRNQHGLAYSAYSYFIPMKERGPFILGCQTRNDKAPEAEKMLQSLLKDFVNKGPTDEELDVAKKNLLGGYALQFSSNSDICNQVAALGYYDLNLDYFNQYKSAVERLTVRDIKKAFQRRVTPDKLVVVTVGGKADTSQPSKPIPPQEQSRSHDIRG